jgi:hypothetical protein
MGERYGELNEGTVPSRPPHHPQSLGYPSADPDADAPRHGAGDTQRCPQEDGLKERAEPKERPRGTASPITVHGRTRCGDGVWADKRHGRPPVS